MDKKQKVLFLAGFPRAGSTLLANILSQNPLLHGTATSGLVGSTLNIKENWKNSDIYRSNPEEYIYPRIKSMMKNQMIGFYEKEVLQGVIPIDKNRAWSNHIDFLEEVFNCKIKILYPVRHVADICVSLEKVNRKSTLNNHGDNGDWVNEKTTEGRLQNLIKDDGVLGSTILSLREIIYRGQEDRLVFIPFNDLLVYPKDTLNRVYDQLELPRFEHDFENIKQVIEEHDTAHGFAPHSLHSIREGKLEKPQTRDYSIIKKEKMEELELTIFGDITDKINEISIIKGIV